MYTYNYFSGEPVNGSPNLAFGGPPNATTNMNTSSYSYDPFARLQQQSITIPNEVLFANPQPALNPTIGNNQMYQQPQQMPQQQMPQPMIQAGYNGYNGTPYMMQQPFMNPPINPYMQQPNPYMQQPYGYAGNPAFAYMQQLGYNPYTMAGMQQQPQYEDKVVHVPGYKAEQVLISPDLEKICDDLQLQMVIDQQTAIENRQNRFQGYFNNNFAGYNYYGNPYMDSREDQAVTAKYRRKVEELRDEALQRRKTFNKRLSSLCHNYLNDGVKEEDIDRLYDGYTYVIPAQYQRNSAEVNRFANMVPINNQKVYVDNFNQIQNSYNKLMDPNSNMQDFLRAQGVIKIAYDLDEEMHRRRDDSKLYQNDSYRQFLIKSIRERNAQNSSDQNSSYRPAQPQNYPQAYSYMTPEQRKASAILDGLPTLRDSATIMEDGSLCISAPDWVGRSGSVVMNELESKEDENRQRFLESIYKQNVGGA